MEKDIKHYKLGNTIQEFEELFGNTPFDDIEKIKKYLFQNYIPKSKIKEKIEPVIDSLEKNGFVGYADELRDIISELMEDK